MAYDPNTGTDTSDTGYDGPVAYPQAGPADHSVPGTYNYYPGGGGPNGSGADQNGSANGQDGGMNAGSGGAADTGGTPGSSDNGGTGAGGSSANAGSDNPGSDNPGDTSGSGSTDGGGTSAGGADHAGGLVPDALSDTQSILGTAADDLQTGSASGLVADAVNGAGQLADHAVANLGADAGSITGTSGGLIPDAVSDTQAILGTAADDLQTSSASGLVADAVNGAGQLADHAVGNLGAATGTISGTSGGLIPDAVNDTQAILGTAASDLHTSSASGLVADAASGAGQLVDHAATNLGAGDLAGDHLVFPDLNGAGTDALTGVIQDAAPTAGDVIALPETSVAADAATLAPLDLGVTGDAHTTHDSVDAHASLTGTLAHVI
jgi:hypothetical protein